MEPVGKITRSFADYCTFVMQSCKFVVEMSYYTAEVCLMFCQRNSAEMWLYNILVFNIVANCGRLRDSLGHGELIYIWFPSLFIVLLIKFSNSVLCSKYSEAVNGLINITRNKGQKIGVLFFKDGIFYFTQLSHLKCVGNLATQKLTITKKFKWF